MAGTVEFMSLFVIQHIHFSYRTRWLYVRR